MVNLNWMAVKSPRNTLNLVAISNMESSVILKLCCETAPLRWFWSNSGRSAALSGISSTGVFPSDTCSHTLCLHTAQTTNYWLHQRGWSDYCQPVAWTNIVTQIFILRWTAGQFGQQKQQQQQQQQPLFIWLLWKFSLALFDVAPILKLKYFLMSWKITVDLCIYTQWVT